MKKTCDMRKIIEFLDGDMPAREAGVFAEHLAECEACQKAADEMEISLEAARAIMEAEGQALYPESLAPSVMRMIRSERAHAGYLWRWATAAVAAAMLALMIFSGAPVQNESADESQRQVASSERATCLVVSVQPDRFNVEDRKDGIVREVFVQP